MALIIYLWIEANIISMTLVLSTSREDLQRHQSSDADGDFRVMNWQFDASLERVAWGRLARKLHPDLCGPEDLASTAMQFAPWPRRYVTVERAQLNVSSKHYQCHSASSAECCSLDADIASTWEPTSGFDRHSHVMTQCFRSLSQFKGFQRHRSCLICWIVFDTVIDIIDLWLPTIAMFSPRLQWNKPMTPSCQLISSLPPPEHMRSS